MCEGSHPEVIVISPSSSLPITHLLLTDEAGEAPLLTLSTYHRRFDFVSNCLGTKWILASPSKLFCDELKVKYKLLTVSCKLTRFLMSLQPPMASFFVSVLYGATLEFHSLQRGAPN